MNYQYCFSEYYESNKHFKESEIISILVYDSLINFKVTMDTPGSPASLFTRISNYYDNLDF